MKVIEKKYKILEVDKKNKNHRAYTKSLISGWIKSDLNKLKNDNDGYDLEYAIDDISDEVKEDRDIYHEFISSSLSCGVVNNLSLDKKGVLWSTVKFKMPDSCSGLTKKIYDGELSLDNLSIVPKGKGSVKNQTVQDDYELYGFNLILLEDSAFKKEEEESKKVESVEKEGN